MLAAHRAEFERVEPDPGYTGDVGACVAGTTSRAFRDSELQRINWYRRMAGVDVVTERADYTSAAQHAALMMAAAGELSHAPPRSWPCYSELGAGGASKSNLGFGNSGVAAVDSYVRDGGSGNEPVGHRGWVLSPYVRAVGMGTALDSSRANALHVLGDLTGSADRLREVRGFVAWPPPGYVPAEVVYRRWSFRAFGDFDYSTASVAVVGETGAALTEIVHRGRATSHLSRPALVWEVADVPSYGTMPEPTGGDDCYTVTVSGVRVGGAVQEPYEYATCLLDLSIESTQVTGLFGPQNLRAAAVGHDSVTLSWGLARQPPGVTVRNHLVERFGDGQWIELHRSATALTGYEARGLRPATDYQFRVRLDTSAGDASGTVTVTTRAAPAAGAITDPGGDGGLGDLDVRIVARRVVSGRVEFALQQRESDGEWGARLLPRQRFFPEGTRVGRWLVSTPLTVGGATVDPEGDEAQVRIVARRVASGRVEFGLQQWAPDGGWGERLLPRQRFFPVGTRVGRWLVSTPLTLSAGTSATSTDLPPGVDTTTTTTTIPATTTTTTTTTTTPQPSVDPAEELASLVLAGANRLRGRAAPLALDAGLSVAARARARAQVDSGDWDHGFDYGPLLASEWGVWRAGMSSSIATNFDRSSVARSLSESLLDEDGHEALRCELCTHLGVGVASRGGRTYATVIVAGPAPAGSEIAAAEAQMLDLVNRLRQSLGLEALAHHTDVAAVARRWSQTLVAERDHYHNPRYAEQYPPGYERYAENVASIVGITSLRDAVQESFDNLVNSPGHYANMTDPAFTHLGVGIAVGGGRYSVTQNFARYAVATQPEQPEQPEPSEQAEPPELPGRASVSAAGGVNELSARWSADDNGSPITHWIVVGTRVAATTTGYHWTERRAGSYTITVQACNAAGCGPEGSDTVTVTDLTPQARTVRLSQGRNAQGVDAGCTSANCHFMRVELVDFAPGSYTVYCLHYGVAGHPAGYWEKYTTSNTTSEYCIWGYVGHSTYVLVEDPATGERVRSNDAAWG